MSPARLAKLETAMRTVLAFNEALNRHDVDGMMLLMTDDCVFENECQTLDCPACSAQLMACQADQ